MERTSAALQSVSLRQVISMLSSAAFLACNSTSMPAPKASARPARLLLNVYYVPICAHVRMYVQAIYCLSVNEFYSSTACLPYVLHASERLFFLSFGSGGGVDSSKRPASSPALQERRQGNVRPSLPFLHFIEVAAGRPARHCL